jgi:hypothetical protein
MKERRKEKRRRKMMKVSHLEVLPFYLSPWAIWVCQHT